jgi:hypothetical protein
MKKTLLFSAIMVAMAVAAQSPPEKELPTKIEQGRFQFQPAKPL